MLKYIVLMVFTLPFAIFGILKALISYKGSDINRGSLLIRLVFWLIISVGIIFAGQFYDFLIRKNLTDSPPISLADVVLVIGVVFSLFLIVRLYSKLDNVEKRLSLLHERTSINFSKESLDDKEKAVKQKR